MRHLKGQMRTGHRPAPKPARRQRAFLREGKGKLSPEVNSSTSTVRLSASSSSGIVGIKSLT